jgi:large subunit ribosomal protein L17
MLSNLVASLFEKGRIRTTQAKAKQGRRLAEKLITMAKRGDLHARRQVLKAVHDKPIVKRLFDEIGPRFAQRNGGYTRIVKLGSRLGDQAPMVLFELLGEPAVIEAKGEKEKRKKQKAAQGKKAAKKGPQKAKAKPVAKKGDEKRMKKSAALPAAEKKRKTKTRSSKTTPQG